MCFLFVHIFNFYVSFSPCNPKMGNSERSFGFANQIPIFETKPINQWSVKKEPKEKENKQQSAFVDTINIKCLTLFESRLEIIVFIFACRQNELSLSLGQYNVVFVHFFTSSSSFACFSLTHAVNVFIVGFFFIYSIGLCLV